MTADTHRDTIDRSAEVAQLLFTNLTTVVRGKPDQLRLAIATVLSGGTS